MQKPQSTISALRRSFLEGGEGEGGGMTEWEKRLASSPLRRVDDSPMIEPLEPDEVRQSWMGSLVALGSQTPAVGKCCFSAVTWNFFH